MSWREPDHVRGDKIVTDSVDRKGEAKAAQLARLKDLPTVAMKDRIGPNQIPQWVKVATARMEVLGETYAEAAEPFGRKGATLNRYASAPWVQEWRLGFREIMEDPDEVARLILKGSIVEAAMDQLWAIQTAKNRGDFKEVRLGTRDILQSHDLMVTQQRGGGAQQGVVINITMPKGVSAEPLTVEADYEVIEQEEIDE